MEDFFRTMHAVLLVGSDFASGTGKHRNVDIGANVVTDEFQMTVSENRLDSADVMRFCGSVVVDVRIRDVERRGIGITF
jgi:hypothetical protein